MDFSFSEEQRIFTDSVRKFLVREVEPLVEEAESTQKFPKQLIKKFADVGYLGMVYPEEVGGSGLDYVTFCILAEELGKVNSGFAGSILAHCSIATYPIFLMGTDEQKERFLKPAIAGELVGCFALTEPGAGSDAAGIQTTAVRDGDHYVLNGAKTFITNSTFCDFAVVAAKTDREKGAKGVSIFVVEADTPGFIKGPKIEKLGNRSQETGELTFEDCRVPASNRLGEEGEGFLTLMQALNGGRMIVAARSVGVAQAAFEAALKYSGEREQFGRPIKKFQLIGAKLAQMATEIEAARLLVYHAAWLKDQGKDHIQAASMAKLKATETAVMVTGEALQIHGGYGYSTEFPVERYFRDAKATTIVEGTTEIQLVIISRRLGD